MDKYEIITIKSTKDLNKPTVYYYLKNQQFSESYIKKLRNFPNAILLNNTPATTRDIIKDGDILKILTNPSKQTQIGLCNKNNLNIIFEDDDFLIINKPHNLACMPTQSHYNENLGGQICAYMNEKDKDFVLRIKNRLDKDTAGIIVVAKNLLAYHNLNQIDKEYHALCQNPFLQSQQTIDKPIETQTINGVNIMKRVISENGKRAITHVSLIKNYKDYSLVKCTLETGRTHQIRVHLASINHPLIGDELYNSTTQSSSHTMLILKKINFVHFRTKSNLNFEIEYPEEWFEYLQK